MNVSFENVDKVSALLTIKIEKKDYEDKVAAAIKDFRKKANIPGFRPGQAPVGLLKKRFGTEITAEEVNKVLMDASYNYIREQKINILGEPMINTEKQPAIDFKNMEEFTFVFDLALAPEFEISLTAGDALDHYVITVSDEMVDKQVQNYAQRGGHHEKVDQYQEHDMVKGVLAQLDESGNVLEGGIQVDGAVMLPDYMKNEEEKAKFADAKVNDVIIFNPDKAYEHSEVELSTLLKISKEDAANMTSDFSYQIVEITRYMPSELNQELFDNVLGAGVVSSEEEFRAYVKKQMESQFALDSEYKFGMDLRKFATDRVGKLEMPEALLKRFLESRNPDKDPQALEANFAASLQELSWHLVREKLCEQLDVKIDHNDVLEVSKDMTRMQFAQYGMINVPEDVLTQYAQKALENKGQVEGMTERAIEKKLAKKVMEVVTLTEKNVTLDEFNKMFEEQ